MQVRIFLILMFCSTSTLLAKDSPTYGINLGYINSRSFPYPTFSSDFTMDYHKSSLIAGLTVGPNWDLNSEWGSYGNLTFTGVNFAYQFHPVPESGKFNFYFLFLLNLMTDTDKGYTNHFGNVFYNFYSNYTARVFRTDFSIGYGFRFYLFKNIYISQNIGVGLWYEHIRTDADLLPLGISDDFSGRYALQIGLGYRFDKSKPAGSD